MKINTYLIQLSLMNIIIFGGTFTIHLIRNGEGLIDQIIGCFIGVFILLFSLIWRLTKKQQTKKII